jgi:hypothetical protein
MVIKNPDTFDKKFITLMSVPVPEIQDLVKQGRINRNNEIRSYFEKRYNQGARYELIEQEIILKWGLSPSTIYQIIKNYGYYGNK